MMIDRTGMTLTMILIRVKKNWMEPCSLVALAILTRIFSWEISPRSNQGYVKSSGGYEEMKPPK